MKKKKYVKSVSSSTGLVFDKEYRLHGVTFNPDFMSGVCMLIKIKKKYRLFDACHFDIQRWTDGETLNFTKEPKKIDD